MSMWAALKAARAVELATDVVAIECLAASQAIDLLAPLGTSAPLAAVHAAIRAEIDWVSWDRCQLAEQAETASLRQVLTAWSKVKHGHASE